MFQVSGGRAGQWGMHYKHSYQAKRDGYVRGSH